MMIKKKKNNESSKYGEDTFTGKVNLLQKLTWGTKALALEFNFFLSVILLVLSRSLSISLFPFLMVLKYYCPYFLLMSCFETLVLYLYLYL